MDIHNIQDICPLYFGETTYVQNVSTIEHGLANEHYKISLDHCESYFLKVYRYNTESIVSDELNLTMTLKKKFGIATPQVITTISGHLYTKHQGHYLALFEFIEGSHPEPTCDNLVRIGRTIAQIHQCKPDMNLNAYRSCLPEDLFSAIRTLPTPEPSTAAFFQTAILMTENLPFDRLPKSLTHCDIFLDNLIKTKDNIYVIDFELAAFDHCLLDLSRAIIGCCKRQKMLDIALCKALLKGYFMRRSLSEIEQEYLYEYTIYAGLLSTFWRYEEFNIKRPYEGKKQIYKELMLPTIQLINMGKVNYYKELFGA